MLSSLFSLVLAAIIHLHHLQVPVVTGQDVAVAQVKVPEGASPEWKVTLKGINKDALDKYYVKDGLLYVNIREDPGQNLSKPFRIRVKAHGFRVEETGIR